VDIAAWLRDLGLERYEQAFRENEIDAEILPKLTADDLKDIGVTIVGHRRKLLEAISALAGPRAGPPSAPQVEPSGPAEAAPAATPADAERRQLTVMFVDLVGSTALSARLDPEDMSQVIRSYQRCCAEAVGRWGGHVAKYMGDGVLAYFGWPQAHENEAERAVRAGLELVEAVRALDAPGLAPGGAHEGGQSLVPRVGIATGLVMVGELIGEGAAQEQTVVGETPNLAARLQELAAPGSVVISQATRRLVGGLFELTDLGPRRLKGFAEPLAAFQVVGEGRAEGRFEALHGELLTPLVGREHELGILLERWAWARDGDGQVVLLSGEPGIGKSRLTRSVLERPIDEPHTRLRYYGSPYHVNSALFPVIDQLERAAGFRPEDTAETRLDKLEAVLARATDDLAEVVPLIAALLSIPTGDRYPPVSLPPEVLKAKTFEAMLGQIEGLAKHQPVLMVFEDAQWIDPTSGELFGLVIDRIQHLPVLLLITFRPDFAPPWTGHAHVTSLSLSRLGQRQGARIVERLTGGKPLPAEVLQQILSKTDGVPLFVEELTKTVLESGLLRDASDRYELSGPLPLLAIPTTLHDSLMARLDRLAPVKQIAQIGAVIGREFSHELLAAVADLPEDELRSAVGQLAQAELILRRGTAPDVSYAFKHALVQDAAYQCLLKSRRQQLHARIAEILEARFGRTTESEPELLAHHYRHAGLLERAVPYTIRAGDLASKGFAFVEARARHQEALDLARALPPSEQAWRFQIRATLKLANVASNRTQFEQDLANLEHARSLAEQLDHRPRLAQIYYWMARLHYVLGQLDQGIKLGEVAHRIAEELGDDRATAGPVNLLGRFYFVRGQPEPASEFASRSVRQMHDLGDYVEEAGVSATLGSSYAMLGRFREGVDAIQHGLRVAERIEHLPTVAACLFNLGMVRGWHGDRGDSLQCFERALAISTELNDLFRVYLIHGNRGQAHLLANDFRSAEGDLLLCLNLASEIGTNFLLGSFRAYLAEARLRAGDVAAAAELCREAVQIAIETDQPWSLGIAWRAYAQCLLTADPPDPQGAEEAIQKAIAIQESYGTRIELAWSLTVLARVEGRVGAGAKARETFARAAEMFEAMGIERDLARVREALAELDRQSAVQDGALIG
jgi:class 3 adenylate cyclase/tetratricopeptide (TPR) repeat protein